MITLPGELFIKTVYGRNGPFNVGRLVVSLGKYAVKDAELDQFKEGRYEGNFVISAIRQHPTPTEVGTFMELRAHLSGMTLHGIDRLSEADAKNIGAQESDPVDEESKTGAVAPAPEPASKAVAMPQPVASPSDQSTDGPGSQAKQATAKPGPQRSTSSKETASTSATDAADAPSSDATLFGALWPLPDVFKLDATVGRITFRKQRDRLNDMGYDFDPISQEWSMPALAE